MKQIKQSLEVVIVITLVVAALSVAASESVMWLTRRNLEVQFQAGVAKVTNVEELGQVFEQFAPRFQKAQSLFRFVNGPKASLNLSRAEEDYDGDQQPRDSFTEPKIDCGLLGEELIKAAHELAKARLDLSLVQMFNDPEALSSEEGQIMMNRLRSDFITWQYQYEAMLEAYLTKCFRMIIL